MGSLLGALFLIGFKLDTSTVHAATFTKDDLKTLAVSIAVAHDLDSKKFLAVLDCESRFDPTIIGDKGTSFGIAQFRHPERDWGFTKEKALQPIFAMTAMAEAWEKGLQKRWSCFSKDI